jgi:hypothetical protein
VECRGDGAGEAQVLSRGATGNSPTQGVNAIRSNKKATP